MFNLITIGDALIDTHVQIDDASVECDLDNKNCKLCLDWASKIPITDSFQSLGGNAANVAVGAAKLSLNTAILTHLGPDGNGKLARGELKKFGVNTSLIFTDQKSITRYSVVLNFKGERTILAYHKKRNYTWPKKMPASDWIYYTSLSEGFEKLQDNLIKFLDKHPTVRLALNPGSYQMKYALSSVCELLPRTDLLIVNLEEAEQLTTASRGTKSCAPTTLVHYLLQMGAKEVAITDASRGAWAGNIDQIWHLDAYPVNVISKTGAGDAFSAGYLTARLKLHDISTALSWGIADSCSVITAHGPHKNLLDERGVKKMIEKFANIQTVSV